MREDCGPGFLKFEICGVFRILQINRRNSSEVTMESVRRILGLVFLLFPLCRLPLLSQSGPPATPVRDVKEDYFGSTVVDPYRWLEKTSTPEVADCN